MIPTAKLEKLSKKLPKTPGLKRRNAWVFVLGGVVGLLAAGLFASPTGSVDRMVQMAGLQDLSLDSILDVLPAGLIKDIRDMQVCAPLRVGETSHLLTLKLTKASIVVVK